MPGAKPTKSEPGGQKNGGQKWPTSRIKSAADRSRKNTLSERERMFVSHYVATGNGTYAAREAGYSERSAHIQCHTLLNRPRIAEAIARKRAALQERVDLQTADLARPLIKILQTGMSKFMTLNEWGEPSIDLSKCSQDELDCLAEVQIDDVIESRGDPNTGEGRRTIRRVKIKPINRLDAVEKLAKLFGLYENDRAGARRDDAIASLIEEINNRGSKPHLSKTQDIIDAEIVREQGVT